MMQIQKVMRSRFGNNRGFTLIEVIAVLVILAIAGAVVLSRATGTDEANLRAQVDTLKSHIRYAQFRAMNMESATSGCNSSFGISIGTNTYFMFRNCSTATADKVVLPGANSNTVTLSNVTLTPSPSVITFDDWGRPCNDISGNTPAAGSINVSSTGVSPETITITITANTGFVQ